MEDLVKISEKVQKLIKEKDTDGVVSYTYHDETSTAQTLQAKLSTLERYAENVNTYINKKIDRPFYEAMDKVGAKLEALNIQQYKTTNKIGYKRIESVKDPYGHPVGTKEVTPPEIGIDELYKVDSPYKASLKKSYEEYKKSKDYKDSRLTETEYVQVMHQTRSFEYVSIDDEKSTTEMWRDLTLTAATVVLYVFCPPAGAVLSTVVSAAEMYSAASGKDWGTGRELDNTERGMRGAFALLDLIPAGKYLGTLAKTGKTAGLTAVKTSLKTAIKEGLERAKQFTLEVPTVVVRETSTGSQIMRFEKMSKSLGDTGLGKSLDNLASKAKQVENTRLDKLRARNAFYGNKVDDVAKGAKEAAEQAGKKARQEFRQEASEQLAKHSDEIANTAKVVDKVDDAVDANRIPRYVEDTISQINSNKGNPPDGFKGGKLYKNKPLNGEELLPDGTKYKEYDVHPYQKGIPRGPERIVIGEDGSVWYTQDHYQTFTRIK